MKKLLLLSAHFISFLAFAQVPPQGVSYQAIALNGSGNPVVSSPVGLRLSILDNSAAGTVIYTETHIATTNAQGLFNVVIGQGTATLGSFPSIKWETNIKFLKVEMDVTGGTSYALVGTTQLWSVPYAQFAGKVNREDLTGGPDVNYTFSEFFSTSFMTSTTACVFSQGTELADYDTPPNNFAWYSTPISGTPFMKSQNSFLTTTNAYIFSPSTSNDPNALSSWHTYPISGTPYKIKTLSPSSSYVLTSTNAYVFQPDSSGTYVWSSTPISGTIVDITDYSSVYFLGILTSTNAYVYMGNSWVSTAISGTPLKIKHTPAGILVLTSTNAYMYGADVFDFSGSTTPTYSWHNIAMPGSLKLD